MVYIQSIYTYEEQNGKVVKDSYRKYMNGELVESRDLGTKKVAKGIKQGKVPDYIKVISGHKECLDFLYGLVDRFGSTSTVSKVIELCSIQTIMLIDLISEFKGPGIKLLSLEFNEKVKTIGFTIESKKLPTIVKVHYQLNPSKKTVPVNKKGMTDKVNKASQDIKKAHEKHKSIGNKYGSKNVKSK